MMQKTGVSRRSLLGAAVLALPPLRPSWGQTAQSLPSQLLRVAVAAPATTLDPHLSNNGPNNALAMHIFDSLIFNDEKSISQPCLAASWRTLDDTHWAFTLRPGVVFSDGSPFGFNDVKASFDRINGLATTASFRTYARTVKSVLPGASPDTLIIETHTPDPLLLNSLSRIRIISAHFKDAESADFDAGKAAIGTGPFTVTKYSSGSRTLLARNDKYWGKPSEWEQADLHIISEPGPRVAALLSGDVDIIESLPAESLDRIKADRKLHVISGLSSRMTFMGFDFGHEVTPFATDHSGKVLPKNPFLDLRVRQAVNYAINRQAIVDRVMDGQATIAAQYLPPGSPGTSTTLKPAPYDPAKAKALLAEAGYKDGFNLTIHGPNGRYINDSRIIQAIAQMLTRVGIASTVEIQPWSVYATRCGNNEYSFFLGSFGINTGETSNAIVSGNATRDVKLGMGTNNFGRYSNPKLDSILRQALPILDDGKRNALLAQASDIVFEDCAILPLHFESQTLAAKLGINYATRADQYTLAMAVSRA
ncbi:ABC transporter substrate-binding protein [Acidisphaera sp. L21]|uniref:ABC transporter substrate-binding protein n=1 Tax=Acidisphaera sp. L21 TaxID=1641851 RepID=UPI00131D74DD|nr:ABC transporter substrate-binding protein [Acidisphaera sp. L21]